MIERFDGQPTTAHTPELRDKRFKLLVEWGEVSVFHECGSPEPPDVQVRQCYEFLHARSNRLLKRFRSRDDSEPPANIAWQRV